MAKRAEDMASAAVFLSYINCLAIRAIIIIANWHRIKALEFLSWPPRILSQTEADPEGGALSGARRHAAAFDCLFAPRWGIRPRA